MLLFIASQNHAVKVTGNTAELTVYANQHALKHNAIHFEFRIPDGIYVGLLHIMLLEEE